MAAYPTLRNPLLPSPPSESRRLHTRMMSTTTLRASVSTASIRSLVSRSLHQISTAGIRLNQSHRRIQPAMLPKPVHAEKSMSSIKEKPADKTVNKPNEPVVHYNGPCHTLEQLHGEKLAWIRQSSVAEAESVGNPLGDCAPSLVLRKPHTRSQTFPVLNRPPIMSMRPKAMFYLRVLQITCQDSSKQRLFRCSVQINDDICMSTYASSKKCGKNSVQAHFDETFLFDVDRPCSVNMNVYTQQKSANMFITRSRARDVCIGTHTFKISMRPVQKHLQRLVINDPDQPGQSNTFQVLVVYGTYVSRRAQTMLNKPVLFEDYVTLQVRGSYGPRLERFWAVLRGVQLELYDFDFRQSRPPLSVISLRGLQHVYHTMSEEDDDDQVIGIGSGSLVLEFSPRGIHDDDVASFDTATGNCRMYLMAESGIRSREWEKALLYVTSIFHELRHEFEDDGHEEEEEDDDDEYDDDLMSDDDMSEYDVLSDSQDSSRIMDNLTNQFGSSMQMAPPRPTGVIPSKFLWYDDLGRQTY